MNKKKTKNVLNGTKKATKKIKIKKQTVMRRITDLGEKNLNGRK